MASGTFIRLLITLLIIISPFLTVYFTGDNSFWALLFLYSFIPLIIISIDNCTCSGCILSTRCDNKKRFNFVKNFMKFLGYNSDKLNQILYKNEFESSYKSIYKYIKNKYNELN